MIGLTTALLALAVEHRDVAPLAAILLLGALFGAFMTASVVHFERPPFIVTLAGMFLERGARFLLSTQSIAIAPTFMLIAPAMPPASQAVHASSPA
jgi:galactofuranose transport system permease protein